MSIDEVTLDNVPVQPSAPESVEAKSIDIETPTEPQEGAQSEPNAEPEKKEEEESSVIRQMRKQLKNQARMIAEMRSTSAPQEQPQPPLINRNDFADDADYIAAKVLDRVQQSIPQSGPPQIAPLQVKLEEAKKAHSDFDEALRDIDHVFFSDRHQAALNDAMGSLEHGSEVLYHLAKNPELAEEFSMLPPAALAAKIGEIHGDIKRSKTAKPRPSSAPAPITPVSGSVKPIRGYDEMSDEEFVATRRKERLAHKQRYVKS